MSISLGANSYGKQAINLTRVLRKDSWHEIRQITVAIAFQGDFEAVHVDGNNAQVLPTDTMKNTVYALARQELKGSIEEFGISLARHFKTRNAAVSEVSVELTEYNWKRMEFNGIPHPHSFYNGGSEKHYAHVTIADDQLNLSSGIRNLMILKTTDSAFEGYIQDEFTTLKETSDRILATECEVTWNCLQQPENWQTAYVEIRNCLLKTFAFHKSLSVQHTLFAIGKELLENFDFLREVSIKMPNKHHILFNTEQFGIANDNEVFVATTEPYGFITGTVKRDE